MTLEFSLSHAAPSSLEAPLLAVILSQEPVLDDALARLDTAVHGALARSLRAAISAADGTRRSCWSGAMPGCSGCCWWGAARRR